MRLYLTSVKPNPARGENWSPLAVSYMTKILKSKWEGRVRMLGAKGRDLTQMILWCEDLVSQKPEKKGTGESICQRLIRKGHAVRCEVPQILFDPNGADPPTEFSLPYPTGPIQLPPQDGLQTVSLYSPTLYSELEVTFRPVSKHHQGLKVSMEDESMNLIVLEPTRAGTFATDFHFLKQSLISFIVAETETGSTHVERLLHGYQLRWTEGGKDSPNGRLKIGGSSLFPNIPGLPPLLALAFLPCVSVVRDRSVKGSPYHSVGLYEKKLDGRAEFDGSLIIQVELDKEDWDTIKILREMKNEFILKMKAPRDSNGSFDGIKYARTLLDYIQKPRMLVDVSRVAWHTFEDHVPFNPSLSIQPVIFVN